MTKKKLISVIMSVYNTEEVFLREAIESILKQTYTEFEFIIVIDCPTDNSRDIVYEYAAKDKRIKVIDNKENQGLTKNLNIALEASSGQYIARMDADDVAFPERFRKQLQYMENNKNVAVLGARTISPMTGKTTQSNCIKDNEVLRIRMLFGNAGVPHPTAFIRRSFLEENNIRYTEEMKKSQDYKLWSDILEKSGIIEMFPEILLMYRVHDKQISVGDPHRRDTFSLKIASNNILRLLDNVSEYDEDCIRTTWTSDIPQNDVKAYKKWLLTLKKANDKKQIFDKTKFDRELYYIWILKALRRLKNDKKIDMLFDNMFCLYKPAVITYCISNFVNYLNYKMNVKKVDKTDYLGEI